MTLTLYAVIAGHIIGETQVLETRFEYLLRAHTRQQIRIT